MRGMGDKMRELFRGGGGGDRDARRKQFEDLRKQTEEQLAKVLTPDQMKKLQELRRGGGGPGRGRGRRPGGGFGGGFGGGGFGGRRPPQDAPQAAPPDDGGKAPVF